MQVIFLFKLVEGAATSSFGTHVANLAGVPIEVVERADVVSKSFAQQFKKKLEDKQKTSASAKMSLTAQADFAFLFNLAMTDRPPDSIGKSNTLIRMKQTVARYIQE